MLVCAASEKAVGVFALPMLLISLSPLSLSFAELFSAASRNPFYHGFSHGAYPVHSTHSYHRFSANKNYTKSVACLELL